MNLFKIDINSSMVIELSSLGAYLIFTRHLNASYFQRKL